MATVKPVVCLDEAFRRLHGRLRNVAVWTGALWCLAAALGLILAVGLTDWAWHVDLPRHRQLLVASALAVWFVLLVWQVIRPLRRRYDAAETALRIESLRPHWRGALASSVQFASDGCSPAQGAIALQRSLIARTQTNLTEDDLEALVCRRPLRMAAVCVVLVLLAVAVLAGVDPADAGLALHRMAAPHSAPGWPREHTLVLLDSAFETIDPIERTRPSALGERLIVYVDDRSDQLPERVMLHIVSADGRRQSQPLERTTISDRTGNRREIGVAMLPAGSPRIMVRATGGDDDRMPWHQFDFVPRPGIERFKTTLTPPEYSQQPATENVMTTGDVAALVGTTVLLEVQLDRSLRRAEFQENGLPSTFSRLSDDGRRFSVEFVIPATGGTYALDLLSADGMRNTDSARFRVEGIPDREPTVALAQPASDLTVTPQAVIPVRIEAGDDLGLESVRLSIAPPSGSAGEQTRPLPLEAPLAREADLKSQISISDFQLEPGGAMQLRAEAADAWNLDGRHIVRSLPCTLSVVTPEEKLRELLGRQADISQLLESAVERQARALQQTRGLQLQWHTASQWSPDDIDTFRRMARDQSELMLTLCNAERGAVSQSRQILQELDWNRLQDEATTGRLAQLDRELSRLNADIAPTLEQAVSQALRTATLTGEEAPSSPVVVGMLSEVERGQAAASELLADVATLFREWKRHHDLIRSIAEIVSEQSQLNRETRDVGRRTLASQLDELSADNRAALAQLGRRQDLAAEEVHRFEQFLMDLQNRDPSDLEDGSLKLPEIHRLLQLLDEGALVAEMERVGPLITRNAISEAATAQQDIAAALEKLEQAVRGLEAAGPESLMRQTEQALAEAVALQQQQQQLRAEAAAGDSEQHAQQLTTEQRQLADEAANWAERLRRRNLGEAADSAAEAAGSMQAAADRMQGDGPSAAFDAQSTAVARLEQAARTLRNTRNQLEADNTLLEWSRVASMLDAFAERQTQLIGESTRLSEEQTRRTSLSRSQMRSLLNLGTAQGQLAEDVVSLQESAEGSDIIREALEPAIEQMQTAAARLSERSLEDVVRVAQQSALDQLRALRDDLVTGSVSDSQDAPSGRVDEASLDPANWALATQFKVLSRLQSEITRSSAAIRSKSSPDQALTDGQRSELQQLAARQLRLAELLERLLSNSESAEPAS